jgi:hypothetical protein
MLLSAEDSRVLFRAEEQPDGRRRVVDVMRGRDR